MLMVKVLVVFVEDDGSLEIIKLRLHDAIVLCVLIFHRSLILSLVFASLT